MDEVFFHISNLQTKDNKISLFELVKSLSPNINNDNDLSEDEWERGRTAAARYVSLILHIEDQTGLSIVTDDSTIDISEFRKCAQNSIEQFTDRRFVTGVNVNQRGQYVPDDLNFVSQENGEALNSAGEIVPDDTVVVGTGPKYVNGEIELTIKGHDVFSRAQTLLSEVNQ